MQRNGNQNQQRQNGSIIVSKMNSIPVFHSNVRKEETRSEERERENKEGGGGGVRKRSIPRLDPTETKIQHEINAIAPSFGNLVRKEDNVQDDSNASNVRFQLMRKNQLISSIEFANQKKSNSHGDGFEDDEEEEQEEEQQIEIENVIVQELESFSDQDLKLLNASEAAVFASEKSQHKNVLKQLQLQNFQKQVQQRVAGYSEEKRKQIRKGELFSDISDQQQQQQQQQQPQQVAKPEKKKMTKMILKKKKQPTQQSNQQSNQSHSQSQSNQVQSQSNQQSNQVQSQSNQVQSQSNQQSNQVQSQSNQQSNQVQQPNQSQSQSNQQPNHQPNQVQSQSNQQPNQQPNQVQSQSNQQSNQEEFLSTMPLPVESPPPHPHPQSSPEQQQSKPRGLSRKIFNPNNNEIKKKKSTQKKQHNNSNTLSTPIIYSMEDRRYIEALKTQLLDKVRDIGAGSVPPICCCAKSAIDCDPFSMANNCPYYKNPKEFAYALSQLLQSMSIL